MLVVVPASMHKKLGGRSTLKLYLFYPMLKFLCNNPPLRTFRYKREEKTRKCAVFFFRDMGENTFPARHSQFFLFFSSSPTIIFYCYHTTMGMAMCYVTLLLAVLLILCNLQATEATYTCYVGVVSCSFTMGAYPNTHVKSPFPPFV